MDGETLGRRDVTYAPSVRGRPRRFDESDLPDLRRAAVAHAAAHGLSAARCTDVAIVVSELVTNAVVHGGGRGTIASWTEGACVVHEIRDGGTFRTEDAGRRLPPPDQPGGRGLWLVARLSDVVERESTPDGTITRVKLGPRSVSGPC
jgi:anti-sigma regulatory factor (Ser/Thr protein kinase)